MTDSIRLGPFGLRLLQPHQRLNRKATLQLLTGRHGPKNREKDELAVYIWRNPRTAETDKLAVGQFGIDETQPTRIVGPVVLDSKPLSDTMSPELHQVLKELGYTK